jgi:hypothetical protein
MNSINFKKGYSLHIGINRLAADAKVYGSSFDVPNLRACENDAKAIAKLAIDAGFRKTTMLLSESATRQNFFTTIKEYQEELRKGDLFLLSFAGHGGQIPDNSGDEKHDLLDEVWCFHDALVIDDELLEVWKGFDEGVRILVISDSCHSGDILMGSKAERLKGRRMFTGLDHQGVEASIQIMAACREDQLTREKFKGENWHGAFTIGLVESILSDRKQSYPQLFQAAQNQVGKTQNPHRVCTGVHDEAFFEGLAFEI